MDVILIKVTPTGAAVILAGLRALLRDQTLSKDEREFVEGMATQISEGLIVNDTSSEEEVLH